MRTRLGPPTPLNQGRGIKSRKSACATDTHPQCKLTHYEPFDTQDFSLEMW